MTELIDHIWNHGTRSNSENDWSDIGKVSSNFIWGKWPETISWIFWIDKVIWEEPEFNTKVIQEAPKNKSKNSCDGQEYKKVETEVPNTFFKPHWPKSEAHESQNYHNYDCEPNLLGLCFFLFIFNDHINTFFGHRILRLVRYDIFWRFCFFLSNDSIVSFYLNHILA